MACCPVHAIFHVTFEPSTLTSVVLQDPPGGFPRLFGSPAWSFVTQRVLVIGGIFIGRPAISICVVVSQRPSRMGLCATSEAMAKAPTTKAAIRMDFIGDSLCARRTYRRARQPKGTSWGATLS